MSKEGLDINFSSPVTNHELSDNCGVDILGAEENNFWKDNKGANINSIRTKKSIEDSDVVIVKFGEKYKQWNAAFDAGYASALNKSIVVIHGDEHQHPLKEVDAAACAVTKDQVKQSRYSSTSFKVLYNKNMAASKNNKLNDAQIGEIIFMALSDDVSFDSINERFGIDSDQIKRIMKQNISFGSYKKWRERVKKFSMRRMHYK